jgi:predicted enzyme related to lactoylglutathione lyase
MGGVFFKATEPEKIKEWYSKHLGIVSGEYGANFQWLSADEPQKKGNTAWSVFSEKTKYFEPSEKNYMFNYRVENLVELLKVLKTEGIEQVGEIEEYEFGKFGWIMDPEGNKIELWEPVDEKL